MKTPSRTIRPVCLAALVILFALLLAPAAVADTGTLTFGDQRVEPALDLNRAGVAEAFQAVQPADGPLSQLSVYVGAATTATTLVAGVYADRGGHPGALLQSGSRLAPAPGEWNEVTLAAPLHLDSGTTYWIALLGLGGGLQLADRCCGVGGTSPSETGAAATGLPATWSTGEVFPGDGPVSAYGQVELDPTATPLLGDPFVEPQLDQNAPGQAEAFRSTASGDGTLTQASVYLDPSSETTRLAIGVYDDAGGHPGALRGTATIATPQAGGWNSVALPPIPVARGQIYWLALLSPAGSGRVVFRDRCFCGDGTPSEGSSQTTLAGLPSQWSSGRVFLDGPVSLYATQADTTPPDLAVDEPAEGTWLNEANVTVRGSASDADSGLASVTCDGVQAALAGGSFSCDVALQEGSNSIVVRAEDRAGNVRTLTRTVEFGPGLLAGPANASALATVHDFDAGGGVAAEHIGVDDAGRPLARTIVEIAFATDASVAQVDTLLRSIHGRVVSMLDGVAILEVEIPDPGSVPALRAIVDRLSADPVVRYVNESYLSGDDELPANPNYQALTDLAKIAHLLDVKVPAAWNARAAMQLGSRPTVIVGDDFGDGVPNADLAADPNTLVPLEFGTGDPEPHGYHVAGIIAGSFGPEKDSSDRGLVTGVFPGATILHVVDGLLGGEVPEDVFAQRLVAEIRRNTAVGNIVVNTSRNDCTGQAGACLPPDQLRQVTLSWIEEVRGSASIGTVGAGLEGKFLQFTSAGNIKSGGPTDSTENSRYAAAKLLHGLTDANGAPVPNLTNVLVVENDIGNDPAVASGVTCLDAASKRPGDLSAVGDNVWSLTGAKNGAGFKSGTSMATPVATGLAEYVWTLEPRLSPQQLAALLTATAAPVAGLPLTGCDPNEAPAPAINAYDAVLSLDTTQAPLVGDQPVREAILDPAVNPARPGFTEDDLREFVFAYVSNGQPVEPPPLDYSRWDLNGDGFTGGSKTRPFDLDRTGSTLWGADNLSIVKEDIAGLSVAFDESQATDMNILCYYAYSPLYRGDTTVRQQELEPFCLPKVKLSATFPSTAIPGTATPLTVNVTRPDFPTPGQTSPQPGVRIELSATGGSVDVPSGTTDSAGNFQDNATLSSAATPLTITIVARAGQGGPILATTTVTASAPSSIITVTSRTASVGVLALARGEGNGRTKPADPTLTAATLDDSITATSSEPFCLSDVGMGTAHLDYTETSAGGNLQSTHVNLTGSASATVNPLFCSEGDGSGRYGVVFTVANGSTVFHLTGSISASGEEVGDVSDASVGIFLTTPPFSDVVQRQQVKPGSKTFDLAGTLAPGSYGFGVSGVTSAAGCGSNPVPSGSLSANVTLTFG